MRSTWIFIFRFLTASLVQFGLLLFPLRPSAEKFTLGLAAVSTWLIQLCGGAVIRQGAILSAPTRGFAMEILNGCNGVNVVVLLCAAIIAYPAKWKWRLIGLAGGIAAVQGFNFVRLISLFYLGQHNKPLFDFAHLYLWETLILLDAVVVFGWWSRRAA